MLVNHPNYVKVSVTDEISYNIGSFRSYAGKLCYAIIEVPLSFFKYILSMLQWKVNDIYQRFRFVYQEVNTDVTEDEELGRSNTN